MHHTRQQDLPFVGMSHRFVGAENGGVAISAFFVNAPPGGGPRLHRHPYDTIAFVNAGRGRWTVAGREHEAAAGDILIVKAGEVHTFRNTGDEGLVLLDVHVNPHFIQEEVE